MIALLLDFAFYYPLIMSYIWMTGGLIYFVYWERRTSRDPARPPPLSYCPPVSILLPCHNESDNVRETIAWLDRQDYPDFEIIAINDGSRDDTGAILDELLPVYPRLRVIHLASNQGKAMALTMGAMASPNEYFICIDGDALLDAHATTWLMYHLTTGIRVGAVTGNPRIRNRSTLLGKLQVGEFSSIIGLIKRAQRVYGRIFTVSGVIAGFRRTALQRCGYWSTDMVTEDIDISWKLQTDYWDIRYEPNALCWILMPETVRGIWRQRVRWAQGGIEVLMRYSRRVLTWKKRRMWGVLIEYMISIFWAYAMTTVLLLWLLGKLMALPPELRVESIVPQWHGAVLGMTCLVQIGFSMLLDSRYERDMGRYYYWMIWYPLAYWLIGMFTTVVAVPKTLFRKRQARAIWTSPDRGIRP